LSLLLFTVPALAQEPPHDNPDRSPMAKDGYPLAGWHNGLVYLRDPNDNFRVYLQGRAQVDAYAYAGPGVDGLSPSALKPSIFLKRIRPEISGEVLKDIVFYFAGDFGQTAVDNPKGTNETSAAAPGAAPTAGTARFAGAETVRFQAAPTDVFIGYRGLGGLLNAQIGQYDAPFTMENRTSDKYFPYIERSLTVRAVGIPTNKEIGLMLWGETKNKLIYYSAGVFDGDGQNRINMDGRGELMTRWFVHPLYFLKKGDGLENTQIGMSFRYGSRDGTTGCNQDQLMKDPKCIRTAGVTYDYPSMSTPGGWAFWQATYKGAGGFTHVVPSGDQLGLAAELRVPWKRFDLTSEFVYIDNNTREAIEGFQATNTERLGHLFGYSWYAQVGAWPMGNRDINGQPGYQNFAHVDFNKPDPVEPKQALQVLARYEMVNLTYHSNSRGGALDNSNIDGDIVVHSLGIGANYWFTKHIRVSANYNMYYFPDSGPTSPTNAAAGDMAWSSKNRAQAPGNTLPTHVDDDARQHGHDLHEFSMRFAVAL
jgi:hypothetical protein